MKKTLLILATIILATSVYAQTTTRQVKKYPPKPVAAKPVAKPAPPPPPPPPPVIVAPQVDEYSVKGKNFLDPGVGIGTYTLGLPFGVSFEHGFTNEISGGVFVDYSSYNDGGPYGYKLNIVYGGVRASYHFSKLLNLNMPKLDLYGGVSLGYYAANYNYSGTVLAGAYGNTIFPGVHAGARYMFSDNIGGFAEVGYGVSALQVGLSFKF